MHKIRFTANLIIVAILLSLIVATAEDDEGDDWEGGSGPSIIWPSDEPYHGEWDNEIILGSGGGSDLPFTYNDYDFEVNEYATSGILIVGNFTNVIMEDVDIILYGAAVDDNGDRRVIATSESTDPQERIDLDGSPDPERNDDFDRGETGTWTLRVRNWASMTIAVMYDVDIDIYYHGAEFYISEED